MYKFFERTQSCPGVFHHHVPSGRAPQVCNNAILLSLTLFYYFFKSYLEYFFSFSFQRILAKHLCQFSLHSRLAGRLCHKASFHLVMAVCFLWVEEGTRPAQMFIRLRHHNSLSPSQATMAYIGGWLPRQQCLCLMGRSVCWMLILCFFCVRHLLRVQVAFPDGAIYCMLPHTWTERRAAAIRFV